MGRPWRAGQNRVVEFGQWLCETVIKAVPHRHLVMGIPKILRRYFLYDRKLLSELSRCGWESLKAYFRLVSRDSKAVPGATVAIQTFGDFLGFNPHLHVLIPACAAAQHGRQVRRLFSRKRHACLCDACLRRKA